MPAEREFCLDALLDGGQLLLHQTLDLATGDRHELKSFERRATPEKQRPLELLDRACSIVGQIRSSLGYHAFEPAGVEAVRVHPEGVTAFPGDEPIPAQNFSE